MSVHRSQSGAPANPAILIAKNGTVADRLSSEGQTKLALVILVVLMILALLLSSGSGGGWVGKKSLGPEA